MLNCNRPGWLDYDGTEYVELSDVFDPEPTSLADGRAVILDCGRAIGPVLPSLEDADLLLQWCRVSGRLRELCDAAGVDDLMDEFRRRDQADEPFDV